MVTDHSNLERHKSLFLVQEEEETVQNNFLWMQQLLYLCIFNTLFWNTDYTVKLEQSWRYGELGKLHGELGKLPSPCTLP